MEISFENKNLRQLCESQNKAKTQLGKALAIRLKTFLADLDVIENVNELISGRIYSVKLENNILIIEPSNDLKITFSANHINLPLSADDKVDWSRVTRIKIIEIQQNNDKK